jgi:hypothetical protein
LDLLVKSSPGNLFPTHTTSAFPSSLKSCGVARQFLNADSQKYGIAVTSTNAELAKFELIDTWQPLEHQFNDGTIETLFVATKPRLVILNRSKPLMSNASETLPYDKDKCKQEGYKAFSYVAVWFLDNKNISI